MRGRNSQGEELSTARADQGHLSKVHDPVRAEQPPADTQSALAWMGVLLPPCVEIETGLRPHRPLRLVDHLPMDTQETPAQGDPSVRESVRLAEAWPPVHSVATRGLHHVRRRKHTNGQL